MFDHCLQSKGQGYIFVTSVQRPRSIRSSVVTLARPPTSSSLRITDRSFRYASPCLWNQLFLSVLQPYSGTSFSIPGLPIPACFTNLSHCRFTSSLRAASTDLYLDGFFWATRFWFLVVFGTVCNRLNWLFGIFWALINTSFVSYRKYALVGRLEDFIPARSCGKMVDEWA